jgi:signal transduction histidine kinase
VHPGDRAGFARLFKELDAGRNDYQIEYRILLNDGTVRWIHSQGKVEEVDGERIVRGAIVDITKQKTAESAVRELSHKLIGAQEKERARVARELHDGLNQNIALLSLQVGMLRQQPKDLAFVSDQLGQFVSDIDRLSRDVHRISYELHPAKLTQLGLESAIRGLCREFSTEHGVKVDFIAEGLPDDISPDISLCLYRVTQESFQNIFKHSEATAIDVSVRAEGAEVVLTIRDNGIGFDVDAAKAKGGLGLISIDERARHIHGSAEIISAPGEGATIQIRIPIDQ